MIAGWSVPAAAAGRVLWWHAQPAHRALHVPGAGLGVPCAPLLYGHPADDWAAGLLLVEGHVVCRVPAHHAGQPLVNSITRF